MAAPKGNKYYQIRSKHGRDTEYTPDGLLKKANEYFQWCLDNPFKEEQLFHYQGKITKSNASKMRPFTIQGFCNFAEIAENTFLNYENREDFLSITTRIRQIIENQQLEGAASGFLNSNIIARKLGLVDRIDKTTGGESLNQSAEDIKRELAQLLSDED